MIKISTELYQLAIGASPLLVAIALLFWRPAKTISLRIKGVLASPLLFTPMWLLRSSIRTIHSCESLQRDCPAGETRVELIPNYWGPDSTDACGQCLPDGGINLALQLNLARPYLVSAAALLSTIAACWALRQCWQAARARALG